MQRLVFPLFVVALLLSGCGDDSSNDAADDDDATFTEPESRFEVAVGDEFAIVLESNASTAYAWELEAALSTRVVELVRDVYVAPDSDLVGAAGRQELTFRAVGDGSTIIQLWYVRAFDDPPEPDERAQFEVIVGSGVPVDADGPSPGDEPRSTVPDDENAISVMQLLADEPAGDVVVRGLLFDDGSGLVLCEALAESFPPQCPGDRVEIDGEPTADFTQEGGVRWTDRPVVLSGRLVDGRLVLG